MRSVAHQRAPPWCSRSKGARRLYDPCRCQRRGRRARPSRLDPTSSWRCKQGIQTTDCIRQGGAHFDEQNSNSQGRRIARGSREFFFVLIRFSSKRRQHVADEKRLLEPRVGRGQLTSPWTPMNRLGESIGHPSGWWTLARHPNIGG